jgi:hypothetical protein
MTVDEKKTYADLRNVYDGPVKCIFVKIISLCLYIKNSMFKPKINIGIFSMHLF